MKTLFNFVVIFLFPFCLSAQLIGIKTVPVASGDQFLLYPSQNLAMGGVSIALNDPLGDPFFNPAKGALIDEPILITAPIHYRISGDNGSAFTLPVSFLTIRDNWFGGISMAMQKMTEANLNNVQQSLAEQSQNNSYFSCYAGKIIPEKNISIGIGLFWASLKAVDGVDLLYPRSQRIDQSGSNKALRAGIYKEWKNKRSLEAVILYNQFDMTHDVTYNNWMWIDDWNPRIIDGSQVERNQDKTNTWAAHLTYLRPISNSNWRIGNIFTVNLKTHPKIPNYELMNIPRDPGDSWAYNLGLGFSKSAGQSRFALDLIYEPIWTTTWADAADDMQTFSGKIIKAGDKTVNNDFAFSNWILRFGLQSADQPILFQLGVQVHSISYELKQKNYVEEFERTQLESWWEWTASWGFEIEADFFNIRYLGRVTAGTGRPGVNGISERSFMDAGNMAADFLPAPNGGVLLDEAFVLTNQVSIEIPLGN